MIVPLQHALQRDGERLVQLGRSAGFGWTLDNFGGEFPGKSTRSFALYKEDRLIGYVVASSKGPATHIHQIVVSNDEQRSGHGTTLLAATKSAAIDNGDIAITLKVHRDNQRALRFYAEHGFVLADAEAADGGYQKWELPLGPGRVCAVHQPNFLPHFGYFHKAANADVFVLMDEAQVPRGRSFASRNRILSPNGPMWLTLPISKGPKGPSTYNDAEIAASDWKARVCKTLNANYARATYWDEVMEVLEPALEGETLSGVAQRIIHAVSDAVNIDTEFRLMSSLGDLTGQRSDLIIAMCEAVQANRYLSGTGGGRSYNDEEAFGAAGILVRYDEYEPHPYPQLWSREFIPNLSIIDMLFNIGFDATSDRLTNGPRD